MKGLLAALALLFGLAAMSSSAAETPRAKAGEEVFYHVFFRSFADGDHIHIEPWRARAFPVIKDLAVDRSAFDRIIQSGGYVGVNTGGAPDGNALPIAKIAQETAMDAAECIGCGACVAACPNASAMLFLSAKVSHLAHLPRQLHLVA